MSNGASIFPFLPNRQFTIQKYNGSATSPRRSGHGGEAMKESQMDLLRRYLRDADGATAIEYALIASLIAVVIIGAVTLVGTQVSTVFTEVGNALH